MLRRIRPTVVVITLVALLGATGYLLLSTRSTLDSERGRVEARWGALSPSLASRYQRLGGLVTAFEGAGARDRDVTVALRRDLRRWDDAVRGGRTDPGAAVSVANRLEGLTARARSVVAGSRRLQGVAPVTQALAAVDASPPPLAQVAGFNAAVERYEDERSSSVRAPVAPLLGFDRLDTFQAVTSA